MLVFHCVIATGVQISDTQNDYQKTCSKFGDHFIVIHIEITLAESLPHIFYFQTVTCRAWVTSGTNIRRPADPETVPESPFDFSYRTMASFEAL